MIYIVYIYIYIDRLKERDGERLGKITTVQIIPVPNTYFCWEPLRTMCPLTYVL